MVWGEMEVWEQSTLAKDKIPLDSNRQKKNMITPSEMYVIWGIPKL